MRLHVTPPAPSIVGRRADEQHVVPDIPERFGDPTQQPFDTTYRPRLPVPEDALPTLPKEG